MLRIADPQRRDRLLLLNASAIVLLTLLGAAGESLIGATTINPALLTSAEKIQYDGHLRCEETNAVIMTLAKDGVPMKQIVCRLGLSRGLVRTVLRGQRTDIFRVRQSTLDAHLPLLDAQWAGVCRKGAELWRRLRAQGFHGSTRVVSEWATRRRRAEKATDQSLAKVPSARTIARLMTMTRDHLSKAESVTVAAIEAGVLSLVEARMLVERFQTMIRTKVETDLNAWIVDATTSLLASFASPGSRNFSRLNTWPTRSPADASPLPSRRITHGWGPMRLAMPSS